MKDNELVKKLIKQKYKEALEKTKLKLKKKKEKN